MSNVPTTDKKREWVKPTIHRMRIVTVRTGEATGNDEDQVIMAEGSDNPPAIARYAPES